MPNNNNPLTLSAPLSGPVLALNRVPDEVFASGAMGDGLAIDPLNDCLQAPCDGVIIHVARTGHALTIRADNGAEVLMHVGIDTVELNGEGFALLVKDGARVSEGQPLVQFDLDRIARQCKSLVSLIILTNSDRFELTPVALKTVKIGEPLLQIAARTTATAQAAVDNSSFEASASVRITHRGGLHARPAALIRKTAQGFSSQSHLHFADKSASCDSLIGLMGLGIGEGDEVRVSCRGQDAEAALQGLVAALSVAVSEAHHAPVATAAPRRASVEADVLQGVCAAPGLVCGPLFRLSGIELTRRILLPAALPSLFTGLRGALSLSWMFLVAAELIAATQGLGYLLSDGRETSRPDLVIAAILLLAVLGKLSDGLLKRLETRALHWRDSFVGGEG